MNSIEFIGREDELASLNALLSKKSASLVVIKGRRRIGKSRLVEEFARKKRYYSFTGLPPTKKVTAQTQRNEFMRQLGEQLGLPGLNIQDWGDIFSLLANQIKNKGKVIILFDEISWIGSKDSTFLGKLKIAWDTYFSKNAKLILVLCGSVSSWIEKNIISSTGFLGRISLKITLGELSIYECNKLLDIIGFKRSVYEKFTLIALTGGIPWYLELVRPALSSNENIKKLCFEPDGVLVDEYQHIFHDLFGKRLEICKKIVEYLAIKPAEYSDIANHLKYPSGGPLSDYLEDLVTSGFISKDSSWHIKTGKESKISRYRLKDNYLRFYLKYIAPNVSKIKKGQFKEVALNLLSNWNSIIGLQFENIVLNNRPLIQRELKIRAEDIVWDNPYFQRQTTHQLGYQIDYLIQTKYQTLFACEIKFSKNPIGLEVIKETKDRISKLSLPRGYACVPVLIHVNGVTEELEEKGYFVNIIDFSMFLDKIN